MEKLDSYIDEDGYNVIGSRKLRQCFGYQESSTGGCIDLDGRLAVDEWKELLERVAGVNRLILHPKGSKKSKETTANITKNITFTSTAPPTLPLGGSLSSHATRIAKIRDFDSLSPHSLRTWATVRNN